MDRFESVLSVSTADLELLLRGHLPAPWADFWLNPRRLRGSDFLMRWSQGLWSEERLEQAVADTGRYFALAYGPSGTAPDEDVREFELYFERLEHAGLGRLKRPDLLIFPESLASEVEDVVERLGGIQELPFTSEDHPAMRKLLKSAIIAVECENSLWIAKQMPDYGTALSPQRRLGGELGLKKRAVLPTVILKDEDRAVLRSWQQERSVKIHIWHVFYDLAFGLSLDKAEELIRQGKTEPTVQVFQAPGGATTRKTIYKVYYLYAYPLGETEGEVKLVADRIVDKNGHILPYVRFEGGRLKLTAAALTLLDEAAAERL
jgi:hypothetical protein